jgi:dTDP-4-amino-4,6-dideoxygalactose transaminase
MPIGAREIAAAVRLLMRGGLARYATKGPSEVSRFEKELARYIGVEHALGVNSGTSAIMCALAGSGIGPGDEVLVPAYTWVSSAAAPLVIGAVPVLVEVDESLMISPEDIERKLTPRTKAIVPVHMLNLVADMDPIMAIAKKHDLLVIEDACQAIGATYKGRKVGSIGHAAAFSFQQHKNIHSGEGGAFVTNDARFMSRATMFHDVGSYTREGRVETDEPLFVGMNLRMPELSAALLRPQLRHLDEMLERLRAQRRIVLDRFGPGTKANLRPSPHHDPERAVGLTFTFDHPAEAKRFAKGTGVNRLIETGRHVYTNWESILGRRTYHPRIDPYGWLGTPVPKPDCPKTLDILARTCNIKLVPELHPMMFRGAVELMGRGLSGPLETAPA